MSTPTPQPSLSPVQALIRRWPLALALCVIFAVVGYLAGSLLKPTYTAEARVAVGPGDMSAGAIAGFPQATRDMAQDYARWVTQASIAAGGASVTGSPVPESNVISIQSESSDESTATQAAGAAADKLVSAVNTGRGEADPQITLERVQKLGASWAAAKTELDRTTTEFSKVNGNDRSTDAQYNAAAAEVTKAQANESYLQTQLDAQSEKYKAQIAQSSASADLRVIQPAHTIMSNASSLRQRYALLGFGVGLLLALVVATLLERRRAAAASARG